MKEVHNAIVKKKIWSHHDDDNYLVVQVQVGIMCSKDDFKEGDKVKVTVEKI